MINVEVFRSSANAVIFPALMESTRQPGLVILFTRPGVGTVVSLPDDVKDSFIGDHSTSWIKELFVPFNGEITIISGLEQIQQEEDDLNYIDSLLELGLTEHATPEEIIASLYNRIGMLVVKTPGPKAPGSASNAG